jgi:hypothetical protein
MSTVARGRVGGIQFNTWRGCRYIKTQTAPAQPRTALVLQIRAWTTQLVRAWAGLTTDQRTHWNDYAITHTDIDWTNKAKRITALNWFVRCNLRRLWIGAAVITEPPATAAPDAPASFAANNGILQSVLTWTPTAGTDRICDIFHFGPISNGVSPKIERAAHKAFADGESGTTTVTGLTPGRHWFWARILDEDNGLMSTRVLDYADITAA